MSNDPSQNSTKQRNLHKRLLVLFGSLLLVYLTVAYLVLPNFWARYVKHHPAIDDVPGITETRSGIPGDPINVALVGAKPELIKIMLAAKWYPADPLSLKSCLEIAADTVLKRSYKDAPVSSLYLFGRKEDLAFEQPVGNSPRHRHHVRFWQSDRAYENRPIWFGSAIYDEHVGFNRDTGQITHVTAPDIDAERDYLFGDLEKSGDLASLITIDGFHKVLEGRNGGGDPWHTDGRLFLGIIR
jgi:hypothetical protein